MRRFGWAMVAVYVGNKTEPTLNARWTSQVGQDRTIVNLFKGKRGGFFVDLAANDAVRLSNTLTLEQQYGWDGLCIEANPQYFEKLYKRRCQLVQAVVGKDDNAEVQFVFKKVLGGVLGFDNRKATAHTQDVHRFSTVSLEKVFSNLSVPAVIDYLSLDVEGAEEWVLGAFPWHRFAFLAITVERPNPGLRATFKSQGYTYVCDHGGFGDQLWLHPAFPDLRKAVAGLNVTVYANQSRRCS